MTPIIMTIGNCHQPERFHLGKVVVTFRRRDELLKEGWIIHTHSQEEMNRLLDLDGEGCFGDWKDSFKTMFGKEVKNVELGRKTL